MPWWSLKDSDNSRNKSSFAPELGKKQDQQGEQRNGLFGVQLDHFSDLRNLTAVGVLSSICISSYAFYVAYLRRVPQASQVRQSSWRKRSVFGVVTRVGDGDNFHLYHTPGGRALGWGWLRQVPKDPKALKDRTVHVRLAGVDAPETAHFGRPAQPWGKEALDWLSAYLMHRRVRAYLHKKDQYDRAVATVYVRRGLLRKNVGLEMIRSGLATVYEAKSGAEFGRFEQKYRKAESWAKARGKGMWRDKGGSLESPRDFKRRMGETAREDA